MIESNAASPRPAQSRPAQSRPAQSRSAQRLDGFPDSEREHVLRSPGTRVAIVPFPVSGV